MLHTNKARDVVKGNKCGHDKAPTKRKEDPFGRRNMPPH